MNRVKINEVWYVPETDKYQEPFYFDPVSYDGCIVEDDEIALEANRLRQDDGTLFTDCTTYIKYTDKSQTNKPVEYWDNPKWLVGILQNDPISLKDLPEMSNASFHLLHALLTHLADKGWFDGVKV